MSLFDENTNESPKTGKDKERYDNARNILYFLFTKFNKSKIVDTTTRANFFKKLYPNLQVKGLLYGGEMESNEAILSDFKNKNKK